MVPFEYYYPAIGINLISAFCFPISFAFVLLLSLSLRIVRLRPHPTQRLLLLRSSHGLNLSSTTRCTYYKRQIRTVIFLYINHSSSNATQEISVSEESRDSSDFPPLAKCLNERMCRPATLKSHIVWICLPLTVPLTHNLVLGHSSFLLNKTINHLSNPLSSSTHSDVQPNPWRTNRSFDYSIKITLDPIIDFIRAAPPPPGQNRSLWRSGSTPRQPFDINSSPEAARRVY